MNIGDIEKHYFAFIKLLVFKSFSCYFITPGGIVTSGIKYFTVYISVVTDENTTADFLGGCVDAKDHFLILGAAI